MADPWLEGLQLDQLKIYRAGELNEPLYRLIRDNIRFPDNAMGDMRSQLAACRLGERRFVELLDRYGKDVVQEAIKRFYAETEQKCRAAVTGLTAGSNLSSSRVLVLMPGFAFVRKVESSLSFAARAYSHE